MNRNKLKSLITFWASKQFNDYEIKAWGNKVILRKPISGNKLLQINTDLANNNLEFCVQRKCELKYNISTLHKMYKSSKYYTINYEISSDDEILSLLTSAYEQYMSIIISLIGKL